MHDISRFQGPYHGKNEALNIYTSKITHLVVVQFQLKSPNLQKMFFEVGSFSRSFLEKTRYWPILPIFSRGKFY